MAQQDFGARLESVVREWPGVEMTPHRFGGVEFREVLDVEPLVGFTLGLGLRGAAALGEGLAQSAVRRRAHPVDAPVDGVEMLLLVGYAGIGIHS